MIYYAQHPKVEFTDWRMEVGMLRLLESQYRALREVQLD
jgi:hypothetical protein